MARFPPARHSLRLPGPAPQRLGVPGESELESRGITFCAICDGPLPFFRNKPLVVVGGGDSACEEALYLTRFGSVVNLVHRRDQLQASKVMVDRVLSNPKIKITWNATVVEILGKEKGAVSDVRLKDTKSGAESTIEASGVFVAIGHIPNTKLLKGQLDMDEVGFIQLHAGSKTIVDGVFGAGDCADRQAITAAGRAARLPSTRSAFSQSPGLDFTAPSNARSAPHEQGIASDGDQVGAELLTNGLQHS